MTAGVLSTAASGPNQPEHPFSGPTDEHSDQAPRVDHRIAKDTQNDERVDSMIPQTAFPCLLVEY